MISCSPPITSHDLPLSFHDLLLSLCQASAVVDCTRHLFATSQPSLLTHVLATHVLAHPRAAPSAVLPPVPVLLPVAETSIGTAYSNGHLERLQASDGAFISSIYLGGADSSGDPSPNSNPDPNPNPPSAASTSAAPTRVVGFRAQGTGHRAQGTGYTAQALPARVVEYRAQAAAHLLEGLLT